MKINRLPFSFIGSFKQEQIAKHFSNVIVSKPYTYQLSAAGLHLQPQKRYQAICNQVTVTKKHPYLGTKLSLN